MALLRLALASAALLAPAAAEGNTGHLTVADVWAAGSYQDLQGTVHVSQSGDRSPGGPPIRKLRTQSPAQTDSPRRSFERLWACITGLVYLALRGLGELPRVMVSTNPQLDLHVDVSDAGRVPSQLEASGMPYEGIYYGKTDLVAAKPSLPLGRVPVLLDYDGQGNALAQSGSIVRY